jgi:hypothetical protein
MILIRNIAFTFITNKLAFWTSRNPVHCMVFRPTFLTDKILNISLHTQPNLKINGKLLSISMFYTIH